MAENDVEIKKRKIEDEAAAETENKDENKEPVELLGCCHCGLVKLKMKSYTPEPYAVCHCMTDTKTAGTFTTNLMAVADSLEITGEEHIKTYRATRTKEDGSTFKSTHQRKFCGECASYLYAFDETYPKNIYPFASCIDTPLKSVPEKDQVHLMMEFKMPHISPPAGVPEENKFSQYPNVSVAQWHRKHGFFVPGDENGM